jgi:hypothetical protein
MKMYAWLCGWTLARAHARSGNRIAIAAYLGNSTKFDNAIADFADAYADQNECDHAALADASPMDESRPSLGSNTMPNGGNGPRHSDAGRACTARLAYPEQDHCDRKLGNAAPDDL